MLNDDELDRLSVMSDLIKTMVEACKTGLVTRAVAESHVTMYAMEIAGILQPHMAPREGTDIGDIQSSK